MDVPARGSVLCDVCAEAACSSLVTTLFDWTGVDAVAGVEDGAGVETCGTSLFVPICAVGAGVVVAAGVSEGAGTALDDSAGVFSAALADVASFLQTSGLHGVDECATGCRVIAEI